MKEMKKVVGILLMWCMLLGMVAEFPIAASAAEGDGRLQIKKFDTVEAIAPTSFRSVGLEQTWGDAPMSLKWDAGVWGNVGPFGTGEADWSEYQWFKMRFYSTGTGIKFNVIPNMDATADVGGKPYYFKEVTVVKEGWQEIAIPLTKDKTQDGFQPNGSSPAWKDVKGLYLNIGGWNTGYAANKYLYVDEIWLEKDTQTYVTNTEGIADGDMVMFDAINPGSITNTPGTCDYPVSINTREGGNGIYAMVDVPAFNDRTFEIYNDSQTPKDISGYRYLNMWIYSPRAINGGLQAVLYSDENKYAIKTLGTIEGTGSIGVFDWKGWKLISMEIKNTAGAASYNVNNKGFDSTAMSKFVINANGWKDTSGVYAGANRGLYAPVWHEAGSFGVEKIWFSNTKPNDPTEVEPPVSGVTTELPAGNIMVKEFNNTGAMKTNTTTGTALQEVFATTRNNYLSQMTLQMNSWSSWSNGIAGDARRSDLYNSDSKKRIDTAFQAEGYNYVNIWMYNPGVKKLTSGNISTLKIHIFYPSSQTAVVDRTQNIDLNWSGWKIVSLPLEDAHRTSGISVLRLEATGKEWADKRNYINVDRVWLSKNKPQALQIADRTVANGAENVSIELDDTKTLSYTFNNVLASDAAEHVSVYKDYAALTKGDDYTVSISDDEQSVKVTFKDAELALSAVYSVKFDSGLRDVFGSSLSQDGVVESFTTETLPYKITDLNLTKNADGKMVGSATVKVYDEATRNFTVIVYENNNNDDELVNVKIASVGVTKDAGRSVIKTEPMDVAGDGTDVRMLIWDIASGMQPYIKPVQYKE